MEVYTNPIRKVGKEVRYWVGVVRGEQEVRVQVEEVGEARWVGWEEAMETVTFDEGREMLRRVKACLGVGVREVGCNGLDGKHSYALSS